jgi:hypothetical protein
MTIDPLPVPAGSTDGPPVRPGARPRRLAALLLAGLAACAAPRDDRSRNALPDPEIDRIQEWTALAGRHFPTYVEALQKFGSDDPADWAEGERLLEMVEKLLDRPVDPKPRKALRSEDPEVRKMVRKALARRGEIFRLWLDLRPTRDELEARTDAARAAARRTRYVRWIKTREAMVALGEDAAILFMDSFLRMLPRAAADEQMVIRDELKACGPRLIPLLVAILNVPPREGTLRLRQQCMLLLAGFLDREEAETALRRYARAEDQTTRKLVADALRETYRGRRVATPRMILEPMLRDDDAWEVRAAAAQALGEIGSAEAVPALIDVLQHCTLPSVEDRVSLNKFIVGALGHLRSPRAIDPLVRILETETNRDVRRNALKALNRITGEYFPTAAEWREWLAAPRRR